MSAPSSRSNSISRNSFRGRWRGHLVTGRSPNLGGGFRPLAERPRRRRRTWRHTTEWECGREAVRIQFMADGGHAAHPSCRTRYNVRRRARGRRRRRPAIRVSGHYHFTVDDLAAMAWLVIRNCRTSVIISSREPRGGWREWARCTMPSSAWPRRRFRLWSRAGRTGSRRRFEA